MKGCFHPMTRFIYLRLRQFYAQHFSSTTKSIEKSIVGSKLSHNWFDKSFQFFPWRDAKLAVWTRLEILPIPSIRRAERGGYANCRGTILFRRGEGTSRRIDDKVWIFLEYCNRGGGGGGGRKIERGDNIRSDTKQNEWESHTYGALLIKCKHMLMWRRVSSAGSNQFIIQISSFFSRFIYLFFFFSFFFSLPFVSIISFLSFDF